MPTSSIRPGRAERLSHSRGKTDPLRYCGVIISLVLVFADVQAQSGAWTRKQDMPKGRVAPCATVVNNKIYVLGGVADISLADFNDNQVYDPSTDTWETKKPLPTPRGFSSVIAVNDTIYAIGGSVHNTTAVVESYDPVTDTWTRKAPMLAPRFGAAAGEVDGIVYNVGGNHIERNCEAYNPATDTWTRKANIPEAYGGVAVAPHGGLLYAFGGGWDRVFSTVYAYDPRTDVWTKKHGMPTARGWSHPATVVNGKIYVMGGYTRATSPFGEILSDIQVYDPGLDTCTKKPDMPFKRAMFGTAVVNGKIYIFGGTEDWSTARSDIWEYDPAFLTGVVSSSGLPKEFILEQNYPNPFNPATVIKYTIGGTRDQGSGARNVKLAVSDLLGREVAVLVNEKKAPGSYEVRFDGTGLSSGVYLYHLRVGDYVSVKTMLLVR